MSEASHWWVRRRTADYDAEPPEDRPKDGPWEGLRDTLWLVAIGAACLAVSLSLGASRAYVGSSRFPLWELFLALGLVAIGGGLLGAFVRDEESPARTRAIGRRTKRRATALLEFAVIPTAEAEPEPPADPMPEPLLRARSVPSEPLPKPRRTAPGPERAPADAGTSSEGALAELDRLSYDLRAPSGGRPVSDDRWTRSAAISPPKPSRPQEAPSGDRCGSCGRRSLDSTASPCPGCGTVLCETCVRSLSPPPCPACLAVE